VQIFRRAFVADALTALHRSDAILSAHITRVGPFLLKRDPDRFGMLVRSILSQQISTKAARAIHRKLADAAGEEGLSPARLLALSDQEFRTAGLSSQKIRYLRDLSQRVDSGALKLSQLHRKPDEDVIAALTEVLGIGRWTAQMFLIFSLGRADVMPHDDLGLRSSLKALYGLTELPTKAQSLAIAEKWRPYASIATWYCWRLSDLLNDPDQDASRYPV
jgi:DNA-3-methyladenine glycosylase II